jgi:hypothetical protein
LSFPFSKFAIFGVFKKNSWEACSCQLFVCWLFSLGTFFLMHKLNVPILVLWKGIILFFPYKKWIKVRKRWDCSGSSVNTNLFYKSYIVYNSIVGWPTINKKNLMSCLHFGIVVVKHFSFYESKTFRFISCFHSITFKNQCFLHFYFLFLFSNHMLVLHALNPSCHIVIFSIEIFLICYTWHNYFLKICLMICEDFYICFFSCT